MFPFLIRTRRHQAKRRVKPRRLAPEPLERRDLLTLLGIVPTNPLITFNNTGVTAYDATTDQFLVDATPLAFQETPASPVRSIVNPRDFKIDIRIDANGTLSGGAPGDDLIVSGSIDIDGVGGIDVSGTLLTGEIVAVGYQNINETDVYDFRFKITGGALVTYNPSWFAGKDIGVTMVSELSTFNDDFTVNFGGGAKGTLGVIDKLGRISGVKYLDITGDGISGDDTGFAGVTIELYRDVDNDGVLTGADGPAIATVVTAGDGSYSFENLNPGRYFVQEIVPAGYARTVPVPGTYTIEVALGSDITGKDFANAKLGRISGAKYRDLKGNGLTPDDVGLGGVKIELYFDANNDGKRNDGGPIATTTTAAITGAYSFDSLLPGRYFVREIVPNGYVRTTPALTDTYTVDVSYGDSAANLNFANFQKCALPCPPKCVKHTVKCKTVATKPSGDSYGKSKCIKVGHVVVQLDPFKSNKSVALNGRFKLTKK